MAVDCDSEPLKLVFANLAMADSISDVSVLVTAARAASRRHTPLYAVSPRLLRNVLFTEALDLAILRLAIVRIGRRWCGQNERGGPEGDYKDAKRMKHKPHSSVEE